MARILQVGCATIGFLVLLAAPVSAQSGAPVQAPSLPPPVTCLRCEMRLPSTNKYRLDSEALPRSAAPAIGAVVGAVAGFVAFRIACHDRSCEMADLGGILGGAVVGYVIGAYIKDPSATPPGRW